MKRRFYLLLIIVVGIIMYNNQLSKESSIADDSLASLITAENIALEKTYQEMLEPVKGIKSSDPKIYWFIVSWLNTNYRTPNWKGYGTVDWKEKTKKRGIDCSGFVRVMQKEIFNKKIRGGSRTILNKYCQRKDSTKLEMGDLVFFRTPGTRNDRIVHVGVYLTDRYFVHATSAKSAAKGLGLMINSLDEENWLDDFVTVGEIK